MVLDWNLPLASSNSKVTFLESLYIPPTTPSKKWELSLKYTLSPICGFAMSLIKFELSFFSAIMPSGDEYFKSRRLISLTNILSNFIKSFVWKLNKLILFSLKSISKSVPFISLTICWSPLILLKSIDFLIILYIYNQI